MKTKNEYILEGIFGLLLVVLAIGAILVAPLIAAALGALVGTGLEWMFPGLVARVLAGLGAEFPIEAWEFGAFLGFVATFFRSSNIKKGN